MQKYAPHFFILVILSALLGCANQGQLSGGKKDEQPPVLNPSKSTPNYQTNFTKQTIILTFDEWLQLKDVTKQIIISPPLRKNGNFDISLKKKSVRFEFGDDEVLRENATYTINFGDAVQDLTERNPVKDLRFVFSTGDFIDSLEVQGTVVDAFDKEPAKDVIVMLYDNLADTVVRTEKPFYFGKTDDQGKFIIKNVRADTFKTFALVDGNGNYLFDNVKEKIGFLVEPIVVTDSTKVNLSFQIFQEDPKLQLGEEDKKKYGRIALGFNRTITGENIQVNFSDVQQKTYLENKKDSIILWYDVPQDTSWQVFVQTDTSRTDTIKISKISRAKFFEDKKLEPTRTINPTTPLDVNPTKTLKIEFKHPLEKTDTSLVTLLVDTLLEKAVPQLIIDSTNKRNLIVEYPFKEKVPYQLQILPNGLIDLYGLTTDTLTQKLNIKAKSEFGDLILKVVDMQPDRSYVLELLDKSDKLMETLVLSGDTTFQKVFKSIEAGKYSVRMILDNNGNGKWDTGNYDNKSQPEPLFTRDLEEVRAGWEVEASVSADEKVGAKKTVPPAPPSDQPSVPKPGRGN
ncbi:MAG: Ig-like domain-containing domain [Bacteroidota bacterium]